MPYRDLSHPIYPDMPAVHHLPPVEFEPLKRMGRGDALNISQVHLGTHSGTHVDAPWHFADTRQTIDQVPLERLTGPAWIVSVDVPAGKPILPTHLEPSLSILAPDDIVVVSTGWAAKFKSPDYHNHPYLADETAWWLVERRVKMVAVDMVTVEMPAANRPADFGYPAHHILLEHDVLVVENITNVAPLAGLRVHLYAFPLPFQGLDGAPARIVAEVGGREN